MLQVVISILFFGTVGGIVAALICEARGAR